MKILVNNKRALSDYIIEEKLEAGIALEGWEVKSLKHSHGSLIGAFIKHINGELILTGSSIPSWKGSADRIAEKQERDRKLLLNKRQILTLSKKTKEQGYTIIPLEFYINDKGLIKLTVALAKGRKKFDKREKLKKLDQQRRIDQELKKFR